MKSYDTTMEIMMTKVLVTQRKIVMYSMRKHFFQKATQVSHQKLLANKEIEFLVQGKIFRTKILIT